MPSSRIVFLILGGICLLAGLNAAFLQLGTWAPISSADDDAHGLVMTLGFLGALISLERAQALAHRDPSKRWAYLAPGLLGLGGLVHAVGGPDTTVGMIGQLLMVEGAIAFVLVYVYLWKRAPLTLVATQILSAVAALSAALLSLAFENSALIPLLSAFLIITIAAERAELAQLSMGPRAVPTLLATSSALLTCATASLLWPILASRAFGVAQLAIAFWLLKDDVPRRLIRSTGLHRFTAFALLFGYLWLIVGALTWIVTGGQVGTVYYDVVIHTVFVGFAIAMIMAHAPVIFPAVMGVPVPYRSFMWVPLVLLNLGLAMRVFGEIFDGQGTIWQHGGILNIVAILLFLLSVIAAVVTGNRKPSRKNRKVTRGRAAVVAAEKGTR